MLLQRVPSSVRLRRRLRKFFGICTEEPLGRLALGFCLSLRGVVRHLRVQHLMLCAGIVTDVDAMLASLLGVDLPLAGMIATLPLHMVAVRDAVRVRPALRELLRTLLPALGPLATAVRDILQGQPGPVLDPSPHGLRQIFTGTEEQHRRQQRLVSLRRGRF